MGVDYIKARVGFLEASAGNKTDLTLFWLPVCKSKTSTPESESEYTVNSKENNPKFNSHTPLRDRNHGRCDQEQLQERVVGQS